MEMTALRVLLPPQKCHLDFVTLVTSVQMHHQELGHRTVITGVVKVNSAQKDPTIEQSLTVVLDTINLILFKDLATNAQLVIGVMDLSVLQVLLLTQTTSLFKLKMTVAGF
jgi:hypothetical protein